MNHFDGLSVQQIDALTDDEIVKTINLACAERGVAVFLDDVGDEPKSDVQPDQEYFKVGQWMFATRGEADAVRDLILKSRRFKRGYNFRHYGETLQAETDDSEVNVETAKLYSPTHYHQYQAEIQVQEQRIAAWKARQKEAEKAGEEKASVASEVWKVVMKARDELREAKRLNDLFAKYVKLADGNRETAKRFLVAAEHLDERWTPADEPTAMPMPEAAAIS